MSEPLVHTSENLSEAWSVAFLRLMSPGVREITPLIVNIEIGQNGAPREDEALRTSLDQYLLKSGNGQCNTVANTIFPQGLWRPGVAKDDAADLYRRYAKILPQLRKYPANRRGTYFERMIAYQPKDCLTEPVNQLNHTVNTFRSGNRRRSALQVSVFDPTRDHTNGRQLGFPCLQHVFFTRTADNQLIINGVYATQYMVERAYGNYLGLCRLGQFVASQLNLPLIRLTCFASLAELGNANKSDLRKLETLAHRVHGNHREELASAHSG